MSETLYYRFVVKRDTAANFTAKNTLLLQGEFGLETDTGKLKLGDGATAWTNLPYRVVVTNGAPPNDGNVLVYDSSIGMWRPGSVAGGGGGGRAYTNPDFANVATLLHMDGTNGSPNFGDQVAGNTWTANNATISTAQSVFAGQAGLFTGASNSGISIPTNSKFDVGSGDWSLEFSIYPNGAHQAFARVFQTRNGDIVGGISLNFTSGQQLGLQLSNDGSNQNVLNASNVGTVAVGKTNRVVLQRYGSSIEVLINGLRTYISSISASASLYYNAADSVIVGGNVSGTSRSINAYLDEVRFTKGVAVVGPEVTLPSDPFPNS